MARTRTSGAFRESARPTVRIMPPTLFGGLLVLTIVTGLVLPSATMGHVALRIAGAGLVVAGAVLNLWSDRQLKQAGTTVKPDGAPTTLIPAGAFRLTRNPMYLGMGAILAGLALAIGSLSALTYALVFVVATDRWFIRREEANLTAVFGPAYLEYRRAVRRWI
jgi:protein-S-isoprenylcysteine O-methyltransferase Ste14